MNNQQEEKKYQEFSKVVKGRLDLNKAGQVFDKIIENEKAAE